MNKEQIISKVRDLIHWGGLADMEADRAVELALEGKDGSAMRHLLVDWLS